MSKSRRDPTALVRRWPITATELRVARYGAAESELEQRHVVAGERRFELRCCGGLQGFAGFTQQL